MKRIFALLLCLTLAALPCFGEELPAPSPDPFESRDGSDLPAPQGDGNGSIELSINDKGVQLFFDDSPDYTTVEDSIIQASFYTYDDASDTLYELYLGFPETVQGGMVITPDYAAVIQANCSVILIISTPTEETYYFASELDGVTYPIGSDYTIRFDDVQDGDAGRTFSGTLSGALVAMDMHSGETSERLTITDAPFSFTMSRYTGRRSAPGSPDLPAAPTQPPLDMRKV